MYDVPQWSHATLSSALARAVAPHGGGSESERFLRSDGVASRAAAQPAASVSLLPDRSYKLTCRIASDFTNGLLGSALGADVSFVGDAVVGFVGMPRVNRLSTLIITVSTRACSRDVNVAAFRTSTEADAGTSTSYASVRCASLAAAAPRPARSLAPAPRTRGAPSFPQEIGYFGSPSAPNSALIPGAQNGRCGGPGAPCGMLQAGQT